MSNTPRLLRERRVFFDSGAYLALLDAQDENHTAAVDLLNQLADARYRPFTTNAVVFESYSLVLSALGRDHAFRFLAGLESGNTVIVRVGPSDEQLAKEILHKYDDKEFSFVDALSFVVMERLRIPVAFAFDRHFTQYGLTILTPDQV
ncbi:MAG: PIN domain-containing protein [Dehalococcoidia bacterium]|nr:PIN domain-containing protein [Dehalococcoidia bacterium]